MENLERNCFYRIMFLFFYILAFEQGKSCPGVGIFVSFFDPGAGVLPEFCTEKLSRGRGF